MVAAGAFEAVEAVFEAAAETRMTNAIHAPELPRTSSAPVIELTNAAREYIMGDTVVHALADASMVVQPGEMVAVIGPSGYCKSTLMNILG